MIIKEEFLNRLRQYFGLNLYEAKIWTALLSRGVSTAGELSDIGDVPRSRAYDVLESLEKKGFVIMKLGKPIKYVAVKPSEVIDRVKKFIGNSAKEKIDTLERLKGGSVLKELDLLFKQGVEFIEPSDLSGAIRGRHNLYAHLESLIKNAKKSVTLMTTSKGLIRKVEALKPELEKLNKRGVRIRIAAPVTKESLDCVKDIMKIAEVKHNNLNARFCIIDDNEVVLMVLDDEKVHPTYDVGVWVRTPYFASALSNMFNTVWNKMENAESVIEKIK